MSMVLWNMGWRAYGYAFEHASKVAIRFTFVDAELKYFIALVPEPS